MDRINFDDIPAAGADVIPRENKTTNLKITMESVKMENKPELNLQPIKETGDGFAFLVSAFNTTKAVTAEASAGGKKIVMSEYLAFAGPAWKLKDFIVGFNKIPAEVTDKITEEEEAELLAILEPLQVEVNDEKKKEFLKDHLNAIITLQNVYRKWY